MKIRHPVLAAGLVLGASLAGCSLADPHERVLEERSRWKVTTLSWAMTADGAITLSTRVSGPAQSTLERLTVRIVLQDAAGNPVHHEWRTLDLSGIERGGPEDILLRLQAPEGASVEGLGIDTVPAPTPEDIPHLEELRL
jgi:hypothetical protein